MQRCKRCIFVYKSQDFRLCFAVGFEVDLSLLCYAMIYKIVKEDFILKVCKRISTVLLATTVLVGVVLAAGMIYDLSGDGVTDVWDLQLATNQALSNAEKGAALQEALQGGDELHKNEQGQWEIYSSLGLYNMAQNARRDDTFLLMQNIDMAGLPWTPIQNFNGTFLAGDFTVSNAAGGLFAPADFQIPADCVSIDLTGWQANTPSVAVTPDTLTIGAAGNYHITGSCNNGNIIVDAPADAKVTLILDDIYLKSEDYAPIYAKSAGDVTIALVSGTENKLENGGSFASLDENKVNGAVYSTGNLVILGQGGLNIICPNDNGISAKDTLTVHAGTIRINAGKHALKADNYITLNGGKLTLEAGKDGIHAENDDDATLGIFTLDGSSVIIRAADDAIDATAALHILSGDISVEECLEGFEAAKVYIGGGNVFINASDDGLNATVGSEIDCYNGEALIHISGGTTEIISLGDAIDSNGDVLITGGSTVCYGPAEYTHGYGALDYVNKAEITGGQFLALTFKGKAFSNTSTQPALNLNLSSVQSANTNVTFTDSEGNRIFDLTAKTRFNCVIVSAPTLVTGETSTVTIGNKILNIYQESLITVTSDSASGTMTQQTYNNLNYWLYTPENPTENMPLIVYLHGGSGKGEDLNLITDVEGFPQFVKEGKISCQAYMIFPQCPSTQKGWNTMANGVADLILYTCQTYKLDSSKVSLTGHSMGGTGTWSIALAKPDLFYKIAPTSGSVKMTDDNLEALSQIPVWAVVGSADTIVDPQSSIDMITALQDIGGVATITILDGVDHFGVPAIAYLDTELVQWLIS